MINWRSLELLTLTSVHRQEPIREGVFYYVTKELEGINGIASTTEN